MIIDKDYREVNKKINERLLELGIKALGLYTSLVKRNGEEVEKSQDFQLLLSLMETYYKNKDEGSLYKSFVVFRAYHQLKAIGMEKTNVAYVPMYETSANSLEITIRSLSSWKEFTFDEVLEVLKSEVFEKQRKEIELKKLFSTNGVQETVMSMTEELYNDFSEEIYNIKIDLNNQIKRIVREEKELLQ